MQIGQSKLILAVQFVISRPANILTSNTDLRHRSGAAGPLPAAVNHLQRSKPEIPI
jgi:hypothetical protein